MKTKKQIYDQIDKLIIERGEVGTEIDHIKAMETLTPSDENRLSYLRNKWNNISGIMTALIWVIDNVRYPVIPPLATKE